MRNFNKYGKTAVLAISMKTNPVLAWERAVNEIFETKSAKEKGCPKGTFLGLCEDGLVKEIPKGNYTNSIKNKGYALKAVSILKNNPNRSFTPRELWEKLDLGDKRYNSQMDVVLALWHNNFIQ